MEHNSKIVAITGSSSGFGYVTAKILAEQGYKVFATMRNTTTRNSAVASQLQTLANENDLDLSVIELDVTNEASVNQAVQKMIDVAGRIDVLVNNAGVNSMGVIEAFSIAQAKKVFEVNLFGVMRVTRAVLPHMRRQGNGLLLHVSSGLGRMVSPNVGIYSASKFALESLAETYRYELAASGVDSVILEPGIYPTGMNEPDTSIKYDDGERQKAYRAIARHGEEMPEGFLEELQKRDIGEIADTIATLIKMPPAERPLRTGVGPEGTAVKPINDSAAQVQAHFFNEAYMTELVQLTK